MLIRGTYHHELATMDNPLYLANFFISVVALAFVMNWLYYRLGRSILAAMIFHAVVNLMAMSLDAEQFSKVIVTVIYLAITIALIAATRGFAGEGPRSFLRKEAQGAA